VTTILDEGDGLILCDWHSQGYDHTILVVFVLVGWIWQNVYHQSFIVDFICNHIDIFLVQMQLGCIRFACGEGNFWVLLTLNASICTWPPIWLAKLPCSGLAQLHQVIFSRIQLIMWVSHSEVFSFFYRDFKLSASEESCSTLCRGHCIMFGWRPLSCEHLLPCNTLNSSKPGRPTNCAPYYTHM
jgi:hypothetical protein